MDCNSQCWDARSTHQLTLSEWRHQFYRLRANHGVAIRKPNNQPGLIGTYECTYSSEQRNNHFGTPGYQQPFSPQLVGPVIVTDFSGLLTGRVNNRTVLEELRDGDEIPNHDVTIAASIVTNCGQVFHQLRQGSFDSYQTLVLIVFHPAEAKASREETQGRGDRQGADVLRRAPEPIGCWGRSFHFHLSQMRQFESPYRSLSTPGRLQ